MGMTEEKYTSLKYTNLMEYDIKGNINIDKNSNLIAYSLSEETKNKLLECKIGLINAGGSCYMASIIQILIHSKLFLEQLYNNKANNKINSLSYHFLNFIEKIASVVGYEDSIEIKYFASEYNKINNKFRGDKGNNPMIFFTEFIKKLSDETNDNILKIFMGKRYVKFKGMPDLNFDEDFIFFLASLNENKYILYDSIFEQKEFEGNNSLKMIEEIKFKPKIFIINLEIDNIEYNFEESIIIDGIQYYLKAINRYTKYHSTA